MKRRLGGGSEDFMVIKMKHVWRFHVDSFLVDEDEEEMFIKSSTNETTINPLGS